MVRTVYRITTVYSAVSPPGLLKLAEERERIEARRVDDAQPWRVTSRSHVSGDYLSIDVGSAVTWSEHPADELLRQSTTIPWHRVHSIVVSIVDDIDTAPDTTEET